jgi:hypothetical protein
MITPRSDAAYSFCLSKAGKNPIGEKKAQSHLGLGGS